VLLFTASCAEAPKEEESAPAPAAAPVAEGPFYELTKDEITSHPDWTSKNITLKGVKIGDKGAAIIEKALGKGDKDKLVESIGEHYRTVYGQSTFAIYTYKNTAELQKIELYGRMADQIADPKFRKLLSTGDLKYMRDTFGMEDKAEVNTNTTGMEYIYEAKGFRFAEYNIPGQKIRALIFSKIVPKKPEPATETKAPETK
jgi:hypothetical protein